MEVHYRACEEGFLRERVVSSALSGKTLVAGATDYSYFLPVSE